MSTYYRGIDARELKSAINPLDFYMRELPGLRARGKWVKTRCCFHDGGTPSLNVNTETGAFVCHASSCCARGGDIVSFTELRYGLTFAEALRAIADAWGVYPSQEWEKPRWNGANHKNRARW